MNIGNAFYRLLLRCYPRAFREEYGGQMLLSFQEQKANGQTAAAYVAATRDAFTVAPKEHAHLFLQDLRYALRGMADHPGFTSVAILSLALGIGANTAIFSVWDSVLRAPLPLVKAPERLVLLTDPGSGGLWTGTAEGERIMLTYTEFLGLRGNVPAFSSMMASQSSLDTWQVRFSGGGWEDLRGRMVSNEYFDVLAVAPAMGRGFSDADEAAQTPGVVISHAYWQRRFAGRADILGQSIEMRAVSLRVIGVMPAGFVGETSAQQPDAWVPLYLQRKITPESDRLTDKPPAKVMWLHVFGRLHPDATMGQAEAQANSIFKAGLQDYYAGVTVPEQKQRLLTQFLRAHSGASGASVARDVFATSLPALFGAVAILLLIACVNLANLLLARAETRRAEIGLRMSLGASRARLIRQSITESAVLATVSAIAGLAVAYFFHQGMIRLMSRTENSLHIEFGLDSSVLAFTILATLCATIVFGAMPARYAADADAGEALKTHGRTVSATGKLSGRVLVSLQLALCLPLLVCAGLLVRTLNNLQRVDLGYPTQGLLQARVHPLSIGLDATRRDQLLATILAGIRSIPGVEAASFSHGGLFTGNRAANTLRIEGYTPSTGEQPQASTDFVEPDFFKVTRIPLLLGRTHLDSDRPGARRALVINDAFAKKYFADRNPLGARVVVEATAGDVESVVVGVVGDSRSQAGALRVPVAPKLYIAAPQSYVGDRLSSYLLVRANGAPGPTLAAMREVVRRAEPALPFLQEATVEEKMEPVFAGTQASAQVAIVFSGVALLLAAIGLYGVLSYSVARRSREIAIRMALGAHPGGVIGMILRETGWVVLGGLVLGAGLAYAATRWLAQALFGVRPLDPVSIAAAVAVLIAISMFAGYLPSRRAAKLDPMVALRRS